MYLYVIVTSSLSLNTKGGVYIVNNDTLNLSSSSSSSSLYFLLI